MEDVDFTTFFVLRCDFRGFFCISPPTWKKKTQLLLLVCIFLAACSVIMGVKWSLWWQERCKFIFSCLQRTKFLNNEADDRHISATEEEKLGSKVDALNKSPSSVHLELDASPIIAILTRTKDRIALNYICWTVHSRWTLEARWPRVWDRGKGPPARPQQQDWVLGVLLGRLIGEFPLNKLHLICLGTRAEFAFWGLIFSTRSQGNEEAQRPQTEALDPLKNI